MVLYYNIGNVTKTLSDKNLFRSFITKVSFEEMSLFPKNNCVARGTDVSVSWI